MDISASIKGIKYKPFLVGNIKFYNYHNTDLSKIRDTKFFLEMNDKNIFFLSKWCSPKRTRSYPLSNIHSALGYQYKKVTIIPIYKDEGFEGDKDFLEWDTISLMSLLGVYTIIAYYSKAMKNPKHEDKITKQVFDYNYIDKKLQEFIDNQSDALHWNLLQLDKVCELTNIALGKYELIAKELNLNMHSKEFTENRINELLKGKDNFMSFSRSLSKSAQKREVKTIQPKEMTKGQKCTITINNYLGGCYFLTLDEFDIKGKDLLMIESKHSKKDILPNKLDIKEGLIKMLLFSNLSDIKCNNLSFNSKPILKLTSNIDFDIKKLTPSKINMLKLLKLESEYNKFDVYINEINLNMIKL